MNEQLRPGTANRAARRARVLRVALAAAFVLACASGASAQGGPGIRGGVSLDPDQFYFGGHYETDPLIENLRFRPNAELGIGDDITTVALNFEFAYWIPLDSPWGLYVGGGPAINIYRFDLGGRFDDQTEAEGGFNVLLGVQHERGLFFEFKVGGLDSPDLKFGVGYSWR